MSTDQAWAGYLDAAVTAARQAGALIKEGLGRAHALETKSSSTDLVTEVDRNSERLIGEILHRRYPEIPMLGEEGTGASYAVANAPGPLWVVDPLDGTTNFVHTLPMSCVCVALVVGGRPEVGVIYDPYRDELFTATRGGGAQLNGRLLRVAPQRTVEESLLATGLPYDLRTAGAGSLKYFSRVAPFCRDVRAIGSAGLELAYVAAGRFGGYWEFHLAPWDTAAGWLLVEEAGGRVTALDGSAYHLGSPTILATSGFIHDELVRMLMDGDRDGQENT